MRGRQVARPWMGSDLLPKHVANLPSLAAKSVQRTAIGFADSASQRFDDFRRGHQLTDVALRMLGDVNKQPANGGG